jgi:uncharacterized membrane protein YgaE (UPF0421/DUF939 family)
MKIKKTMVSIMAIGVLSMSLNAGQNFIPPTGAYGDAESIDININNTVYNYLKVKELEKKVRDLEGQNKGYAKLQNQIIELNSLIKNLANSREKKETKRVRISKEYAKKLERLKELSK